MNRSTNSKPAIKAVDMDTRNTSRLVIVHGSNGLPYFFRGEEVVSVTPRHGSEGPSTVIRLRAGRWIELERRPAEVAAIIWGEEILAA